MSASDLRIDRKSNKIHIVGFLGQENFRVLLASIHAAIHVSGYSDIELNFGECSAAFPAAMLPLCAVCLREQKAGVKFSYVPPAIEKLRKLFLDANWAYLIDPSQTETLFRGYLQVPATLFHDFREQHIAVERVVVAILKSVTGFSRKDFEAFE